MTPRPHNLRTRAKRMKHLLYAEFNAKCYICGKYLMFHQATVDHIIPIKEGGTNGYKGNNLAIACKNCNGKKDAEKRTSDLCAHCGTRRRSPKKKLCGHCSVGREQGTFIRFVSLGDSREVWGLDLFDIRKEMRERRQRQNGKKY